MGPPVPSGPCVHQPDAVLVQCANVRALTVLCSLSIQVTEMLHGRGGRAGDLLLRLHSADGLQLTRASVGEQIGGTVMSLEERITHGHIHFLHS